MMLGAKATIVGHILDVQKYLPWLEMQYASLVCNRSEDGSLLDHSIAYIDELEFSAPNVGSDANKFVRFTETV